MSKTLDAIADLCDRIESDAAKLADMQVLLETVAIAYVNAIDEGLIDGTDIARNALRQLADKYGFDYLSESMRETMFTVEYVVGSKYRVQILATDEDAARSKFDELSSEHGADELEDCEFIEVDTEITDIEANSFQ